ncbi:MAG: SIS domain-containing protein [Anaerolineales bacterium]
MSSYQHDILAQPAALADTLAYLHATALPEELRRGLAEHRWHRVVLTGMGSSLYALMPLYDRLLAAGAPAWLVETSELLYKPYMIPPRTLLVMASQSGASGEIVHLLEQVNPEVSVIGLTNTANSPLDKRAHFAIVTRAGEEATVSCKTYVTALAAQCWLGDQLGLEPRLYGGLGSLAEQVAGYLAQYTEHIKELMPLLEGIQQLYLVGRGLSLPSAGTGGLIMKESVHIAAEGMSSAAFRHGPIEMVGPETFVLVFAGLGPVVELNRKLYNDIIGMGGRAAFVQAGVGTGVWALPACLPQALPILEILPVQMMTLALGKLRQIEPGSFSRATKVTTEE